jgi:DNA-binding protein Fis
MNCTDNTLQERPSLLAEIDPLPLQKPLRQLIKKALAHYFAHTDKQMPPKEVYRMVMEETEIPLLETTLAHTNGNRCKAADILGISRNTLGKKLKQYNLE